MNDDTLFCRDRKEWRAWLQHHSSLSRGIWLIYYKKNVGKPTLLYEDAVQEAICFGWIDGRVRRIDEERYMQHYSPRTARSQWSVANVERARMMIEEGRMTERGHEVFQAGTRGKKLIPSSRRFSIPESLSSALKKDKAAWDNFRKYAPSARLAFVYWVTSAKTATTRDRRIQKAVRLISQGKKFGEEA